MNRFNLVMIALIVVVIAFFGIGIIQVQNHMAATGDVVSVSYTITKGEEEYPDQSATVTIGDNTDNLITDDVVTGLKLKDQFNFETELTEDIPMEEEVLEQGSTVTIDGKVTNITPFQEEDSETGSEAASETGSEATSETGSETSK